MDFILIFFVLCVSCLILIEIIPASKAAYSIMNTANTFNKFINAEPNIKKEKYKAEKSELLGNGTSIKIKYTNYDSIEYEAYIQIDKEKTFYRKACDLYGIVNKEKVPLNVENSVLLCVTPADLGFESVQILKCDELVRKVEKDELIDSPPVGSTQNDNSDFEW